jgi:hypothetical protein
VVEPSTRSPNSSPISQTRSRGAANGQLVGVLGVT